MHRGIGVREGNVARVELFSGWVGSAEGRRGSRAPRWERMSWDELLARGEGKVHEGYGMGGWE